MKKGLVFTKGTATDRQSLFACMGKDEGREYVVVSPDVSDEMAIIEVILKYQPEVILVDGYYDVGDWQLLRGLDMLSYSKLRSRLDGPDQELPSSIRLLRIVHRHRAAQSLLFFFCSQSYVNLTHKLLSLGVDWFCHSALMIEDPEVKDFPKIIMALSQK